MSVLPVLLPLGEVVGIHGACGGVSRVTYRPPRGVVPRGPGVQTCDRCGAVAEWWPTPDAQDAAELRALGSVDDE